MDAGFLVQHGTVFMPLPPARLLLLPTLRLPALVTGTLPRAPPVLLLSRGSRRSARGADVRHLDVGHLNVPVGRRGVHRFCLGRKPKLVSMRVHCRLGRRGEAILFFGGCLGQPQQFDGCGEKRKRKIRSGWDGVLREGRSWGQQEQVPVLLPCCLAQTKNLAALHTNEKAKHPHM
jgi:hypothetical protein